MTLSYIINNKLDLVEYEKMNLKRINKLNQLKYEQRIKINNNKKLNK